MNVIIHLDTALDTKIMFKFDLTLTLPLYWQKLGLASNFGHLSALVC